LGSLAGVIIIGKWAMASHQMMINHEMLMFSHKKSNKPDAAYDCPYPLSHLISAKFSVHLLSPARFSLRVGVPEHFFIHNPIYPVVISYMLWFKLPIYFDDFTIFIYFTYYPILLLEKHSALLLCQRVGNKKCNQEIIAPIVDKKGKKKVDK
jgi:hypothetical protein